MYYRWFTLLDRIYPSPGNAPVWREREAACLWSRYAS
nr:MAG TPA: hypothetical protein [Caudoviricetes sp.]DAM52032.1 MAG TPA: hypothetical protein [Bacteriophage sp.]